VIAKQTQPPPDTTPPSAPSNLEANAGDGKVDLSWGASTDNVDVAGYQVLRNGVDVANVGDSTLIYSDTGLTDGTNYTYQVRAVDAAGNVGVGSNSVTATPKASAPPPVTTWPSTYTNGPLGSNEVLPAVKGHTLLALWTAVGGNTESQQRALAQKRITDMGRVPDVIGFGGCSGSCAPGSSGYDVSSTDLAENWIHARGAIPAVMNYDPGSKDYAAIAAGSYDSRIDAAASRFKAFGHRIMVRMWVEFNIQGAWNTTDFINAWRHVVNRVKADGATNVGWWWSPGEQGDGNGIRAQTDASYPGDAYIDWVGTDNYNGNSGSPCRTGWAEFGYLFGYTSTDCGFGGEERTWGPRKPFVVGETGSKYDASQPDRKKQWFLNIPAALAQMPYMVGVSFFDQDVHIFEPGNNWRVDSPCDRAGSHCTDGSTDANTYSGFLSMAGSPQFSGGAAGGTS
jgi:hypothetical protein